MSITYRDLRTNKIIDKNDIISSNENGITITIGTRYEFIPIEFILKEKIIENGKYKNNIIPQYKIKEINETYSMANSNSEDAFLNEKTSYYFGIESFSISNNYIYSTSGILFPNIEIGNCSHITISADMIINNNSIEFYIVDGMNEIPILPIEQKTVENEKLFTGLKTRFNIDNNKPIEIINDEHVVKTNFEDIDLLDTENLLYTINYTPSEDAWNYFPKSAMIALKVIQRVYTDKTPAINDITLQIYGRKLSWII